MILKTAKLVSSFKSSGLTQKEFCSKQKIALSTLQYHLSKSRKSVSKDTKVTGGSFLPLRINQVPYPPATGSKTVLLLHGDIQTTAIAELFRTIAR